MYERERERVDCWEGGDMMRTSILGLVCVCVFLFLEEGIGQVQDTSLMHAILICSSCGTCSIPLIGFVEPAGGFDSPYPFHKEGSCSHNVVLLHICILLLFHLLAVLSHTQKDAALYRNIYNRKEDFGLCTGARTEISR